MKTIVFTFGRFQCPTIYHGKVFKKMLSYGTDCKVYVSKSHDTDRNPLEPNYKKSLLQEAYPQLQFVLADDIFSVYELLDKAGYEKAIMIVGDDRVDGFKKVWDSASSYKSLKSVVVLSAGERKQGESASEIRKLAINSDLEGFKQKLPAKLRPNAKVIMKKIIQGSNKKVSESFLGFSQFSNLSTVTDWNWIKKTDNKRSAQFQINDKVFCLEFTLDSGSWYADLPTINENNKYMSDRCFWSSIEILKEFVETRRPNLLVFESTKTNLIDKVSHNFRQIGYSVQTNNIAGSTSVTLEKVIKNGY